MSRCAVTLSTYGEGSAAAKQSLEELVAAEVTLSDPCLLGHATRHARVCEHNAANSGGYLQRATQLWYDPRMRGHSRSSKVAQLQWLLRRAN
jgi:hypothetical protein